jgi:hypothetical protein
MATTSIVGGAILGMLSIGKLEIENNPDRMMNRLSTALSTGLSIK